MTSTPRRPNLIVLSKQSTNLIDSLDSFLLAKEAAQCTKKTRAYYEWEIRRFADFCAEQDVSTLAAIEPNTIRRYYIHLADNGLSVRSQDAARRAVQAWLNWCVEEGQLTVSPMRHVEPPRPAHKILPAFTVEQVQALIDACDDLRETAIVRCLVESGLRASEFVALNRGDVNMQTGEVKVRQGKGKKDRVTFFGPKARQALQRYLNSRTAVKDTHPLFVDKNGTVRLGLAGLQKILRLLGQRAGVPHCSPHAFRRTCALWCHRSGWRVTEIQKLLGHADLSVLKQYLDLDDSDIAEAYKRAAPGDMLK